jgi:transcription antitermination protein NusB
VAEQQPAGETRLRPAGRSARRRARELALQGIYEWLVGGQDLAAVEAT